MIDLTGLGTFGQTADDLVKLVGTILQDREPIRHARIMNRLVVILAIKCEHTGISAAVEVGFTCAQLTAEVQQQLTTAVQAEINAAQPHISKPLNIKAMQTDPNLKADSLSLAKTLAQIIKRAALMLGPSKSKLFLQAVLTGMGQEAAQAVTLPNILNNLFAVIQKIAALSRIDAFIKLSVAAQYIAADIENNRSDIFLLIKQFIETAAQVKTLKATASAPNAVDIFLYRLRLAAEELALAQQLGTISVQLAAYFGKDKAAEYIAAITDGINGVDTTQSNTEKTLVDESFTAAIDISKMMGVTSLTTGLTVANNVFDDLASGQVGLVNLFERLEAEKKAVLAPAA